MNVDTIDAYLERVETLVTSTDHDHDHVGPKLLIHVESLVRFVQQQAEFERDDYGWTKRSSRDSL